MTFTPDGQPTMNDVYNPMCRAKDVKLSFYGELYYQTKANILKCCLSWWQEILNEYILISCFQEDGRFLIAIGVPN